MFKRIREIRDLVLLRERTGELPHQIESIRDAITQITSLDVININTFADEIPLLGRYTSYEAQTTPYSGNKTHADIHVLESLNYCWQRFVVCKEMCHAFLDYDNVKVNTTVRLERLVDQLLLPEEARKSVSVIPEYSSENWAMIAAIELLCPIDERRIVIQKRRTQTISIHAIAMDFRIPTAFVEQTFDERYINFIATQFDAEK